MSNPVVVPATLVSPATQIIVQPMVSEYSMNMTCQYCKTQIFTVVKRKVGAFTWLSCVLCSFVACCCLPFCMDSFKDVVHHCPHCGQVVAIYNKL